MYKTFRLSLPILSLLLLLLLLAQNETPIYAFGGDYALDFNGVDELVRLPHPGVVFGSTSLFTETKAISVWVRPLGTGPVNGTDIGNADPIVVDNPRWFGISRTATQIGVWNRDANGVDAIIFDIQPEEWAHIVLVHDGGFLFAYKNGVLIGTQSSGPTALPPGYLTNSNVYLSIGGSGSGSAPKFEGQIDEVGIWDIALSQADIQALMNRTMSNSNPLWNNLRAYYQMSDGSGSTLSDDSQFNNNGTICKIVSTQNCSNLADVHPNPRWFTSGAFAGPRNALAFDGVDDQVNLGTNSNTILGSSWASTKSAEVWVKPTGTPPPITSPNGAALGDQIIGNGNWGIAHAEIDAEDRLWVYNNDAGEDRIGIPYTSGEWVHIALVHYGGSIIAYKNGVQVDSIASGSTNADTTLLIGDLFDGEIDEVRLWRDARTQTEIQDNMFATVAHNAADLAAYYRMDQENDSTVTTVYDAAETPATAHNGAMVNMAPASAWVASTAFNTWIGGDSGDWASGGNWSRYAVPTSSHNVGLINYLASNAPVITTAATANNLTISSDATVTIDTITGGNLTTSGTLLNNGRIQQSQTVNATPVNFAGTGGYGGVTIDPVSANMGVTTVTIKGNQQCTTNNNEAVLRCFDIEPTTAPSSPGASITFYFADSEIPSSMNCADIDAFHYDITTSTWESSALNLVSRDCSGPLNSVTVSGVTNFSPFVLAESVPTAVSMQAISAHQNGWQASLLASGLLLLVTGGLLILRRKKGMQTQ